MTGGRELSRRILRAARVRLRADQKDLATKRSRERAGPYVGHAVCFAGTATLAAAWADDGGRRALLAATFVTAGVACLSARSLGSGLFAPDRLMLLRLLPIRDRDFVLAHLRAKALAFAWLLPFQLVLFLLVLPGRPFLALGAGLVQWAVAAALVLPLAAFAARAPLGRIGFGLVLLAIACGFWDAAGRILEASDLPLFLLPTGWVALATRELATGTPAGLAFLAPAAALAATLTPPAFRRIVADHSAEGAILSAVERPGSPLRGAAAAPVPSGLDVDADPPADEATSEEGPRPEPLDPSLARRRLAAREADGAEPHWERPIERLALRLAGTVRRPLADLLAGGHVDWTSRWKFAAGATLLALLLSVPALRVAGWVTGMAVFLAATVSTPVLGGTWPGLSSAAAAYFPWRFGDGVRILVAANLVRLAAALPLLAANGAAISVAAGRGPAEGTAAALRFALALALVQPGLAALRTSERPTRPDGGSPDLRAALVLSLVAVPGIVAVAAFTVFPGVGAPVSIGGILITSAGAFLLGWRRWLRGDRV